MKRPSPMKIFLGIAALILGLSIGLLQQGKILVGITGILLSLAIYWTLFLMWGTSMSDTVNHKNERHLRWSGIVTIVLAVVFFALGLLA